MNNIVVEPTSTAQWHNLVHEAEDIAHRQLSETLESYLVFTLMRFTSQPELASSILSIEFLESMQQAGPRRTNNLRNVGDKCLLFSGLFPQLAKRRLVRASYFINLGRSAYHEAHHKASQGEAELYKELATDFVAMTDVLNTIRAFDNSSPELDALTAHELWSDTDSQFALKSLKNQIKNSDELTLTKAGPEQILH